MTEGISYKKCTYNEEERKMREKDCRIYRIRQERIKKLALCQNNEEPHFCAVLRCFTR